MAAFRPSTEPIAIIASLSPQPEFLAGGDRHDPASTKDL
jgi:hypothetical protein